MQKSLHFKKHQTGIVVLILMITIVLAAAGYVVSNLSITKVKAGQVKSTLLSLKKAKQAIINHALTNADREVGNDFGILPNPETSNTSDYGTGLGNVGTKNTNLVEWFPWRTLDMPVLKDESGTCLFYAVSGSYRIGSTAQADMVNEDSIGMLQVKNNAGDIIEDEIVALVIAPGKILPGQTRNPLVPLSYCGDDYGNISAYLEGNGVTNNSVLVGNPDEPDTFIHATETSNTEATPYNDKFLTITRDEIWGPIVRRSDFKQKLEDLTEGLAMCLAKYSALTANRRLPWPAITDLGATNNYRTNNNYTDDDLASGGYSGRVPFNVDDSNVVIDPTVAVLTVDSLFEVASCDGLVVSSGATVNLNTALPVTYRKLWNNWKDHIFYILSKAYEPENSGADISCGANDCIEVNPMMTYAGAVIFSGSRLDGVTRNDKSVVNDYLENDKGSEFIDEANDKMGNKTYLYTSPQTDTENDVMYCITNQATTIPLSVIECL